MDKDSHHQSHLASILSVLAMTYSDTGKRETLSFRLISGSTEAPGLWGHEYVRHLAAELGDEYNARIGDETQAHSEEQLRTLALELVAFFLGHNAEADAVDLLLELEMIASIEGAVDEKTYGRVCQYMVK